MKVEYHEEAEKYARAAEVRVHEAWHDSPALGHAALLGELRTAWLQAFAWREAHDSWKAAAENISTRSEEKE